MSITETKKNYQKLEKKIIEHDLSTAPDLLYSLFMNGILTECMIKINDELKSIVNK